VLEPLDHIECRDALLSFSMTGNAAEMGSDHNFAQKNSCSDPVSADHTMKAAQATEAPWPKANVVIGNPPFLGDKKMRSELGDDYTTTLRKTYEGRVPGGADLVCYWFEKARTAIETNGLSAAGLVATNSIRGGKNRKVLEAICDTTRIFEAWSDEGWVNEGAAVRVSLVAFGHAIQQAKLDGQQVSVIHSDLSAHDNSAVSTDLTQAKRIDANRAACFVGTSKKASFDIPGETARAWLTQPNPHGVGNARVVKPWINGSDLVRASSDRWIVDFGVSSSEADAALFEAPFDYVTRVVKPEKAEVRNEAERRKWWLHARTAPDMRNALTAVPRFVATSIVAKHRLWVWRPSEVLASHAVCVVARADDTTFGILHSRFHELWSLRMGTSLEDRPRYTPTTCFETFPFPAGLTPADTAHQRTEVLEGGMVIPAGLPPAPRPPSPGHTCQSHRHRPSRQKTQRPA
jgi:type II restriction/modification system DNA methylase subunit YeeA